MKNLFVFSLGLVVALATSEIVNADNAANSEIKSGPQNGDHLGPFSVVKIAGAEDDGVEAGKSLCYRCRNASRPQVVVFTRSTEPQVAKLLQELDAALVAHEEDQLRCFVNVIGDNKDDAVELAEKFAMTSKTRHIPFVVPNEFENGPENYGINPKAAVTVTLATGGTVKASHSFTRAEDIDVDAVVDDLEKILE